MTNLEVGERYIEVMNARDWVGLSDILSDDFTFSGPVPEALGKQDYLALSHGMGTAFPDIRYNSELVNVSGEEILFSHQLSGTHTGDLDLRFAGGGVVPPTAKFFLNDRETGKAIICDGKICSIHIPAIENAGLPAILRQIGVELPSRHAEAA